MSTAILSRPPGLIFGHKKRSSFQSWRPSVSIRLLSSAQLQRKRILTSSTKSTPILSAETTLFSMPRSVSRLAVEVAVENREAQEAFEDDMEARMEELIREGRARTAERDWAVRGWHGADWERQRAEQAWDGAERARQREEQTRREAEQQLEDAEFERDNAEQGLVEAEEHIIVVTGQNEDLRLQIEEGRADFQVLADHCLALNRERTALHAQARAQQQTIRDIEARLLESDRRNQQLTLALAAARQEETVIKHEPQED
ncbi:hypothetical protein BJ508DRAFT_313683 [Ascobolus immersus RN42]|uniref:Uncharacterized protein n=1 Tax=Ascobolus immersus RN42 TaxID=1160509 RepID=A0A3N4HHV1_ASCIM|nr:hypothetical protein BJ508DRAFT_313683 [Ascobolus immersus RN42]